MGPLPSPQAVIPSVDRVLARCAALIEAHGRERVLAATRSELAALRARLGQGSNGAPGEAEISGIVARLGQRLESESAASLKPVFNLTGTLLHTNLGRALLPAEALRALALAAAHAVNLEFDLERGRRGDRDVHLERLLAERTGAERATAVNNNAAAVLLALNTLAQKREVIVSRGELIEIGGEFRMPEIMKRAGCRLVEVGTTNRTHLRDYAEAIGPRSALILKVHPSNYAVVGFSESVEESALAPLARERALPLMSDLGAGALVDLRRWGLPYEPTVQSMLACGVDLVTFSADKLLGGPQAGLIAGRAQLIARIKRNPLKRALRVDKLRIAALEAMLRLYGDPQRLPQRLPVMRHMTRPVADIEAQARRLAPVVERALGGWASVEALACQSEAGSGSLPSERLPSFGLAITPRRRSATLQGVAAALRSLPVPVVGRIHAGAVLLDLRTLEDEPRFVDQLDALGARGAP